MKPLLAQVLALLLAAALGLTACTDDERAGQRPAPPPSTAPSATPPVAPQVDLAGIVDDPDARIVGVTVRRSDPAVRSVIWSLCRTPRCYRADEVVAVTEDGFTTRHLHALPRQTVETALDGVFLLTNRRGGEILQPDGSLRTVEWEAGPHGPLERSEQAVGIHRLGRVHALDTASGAGHLVPTPAGTRGLRSDGPGRLSVVVEGGRRLLSSYDGGRTWDEGAGFEVPRGMLAHGIGSSTSTAAVVTGGDGATEMPIGALHRWDGDRWQELTRAGDPMAYLGEGGGAVLRDGRLLLSIGGWSDSWQEQPSSLPSGLWLSGGQDWSDLRPVAMGAPFDTLDLRRELPPILDIVVAPREVGVFAVHDSPTGRTLWTSTDAGRTWTPLPSR